MEEYKKKLELLSRNLKYQGSILSVYDDVVRVNGHEAHWDMIKKCNASAVVPVLPNGKLLMVRQIRTAVDGSTLEIPAGKLDYDGEDYLACAKRELEEETGYKSDNIEFLCDIYTAAAFCSEVVRIFVATNLKKGTQHFDEDEEVLVEEWSIDDLKQKIFSGELKDSKTIAGIMSYIVKNKI